jgi:hypothetical protein
VERVVEGDGLELERSRLAEELVPRDRVRNRVLAVRDVDDVLERGQRGADRRERSRKP